MSRSVQGERLGGVAQIRMATMSRSLFSITVQALGGQVHTVALFQVLTRPLEDQCGLALHD